MAKVTINVDSDQQANAIAMMAESGELGTAINEYLETIGAGEYIFTDPDDTIVDFDEHDVLGARHEITFN